MVRNAFRQRHRQLKTDPGKVCRFGGRLPAGTEERVSTAKDEVRKMLDQLPDDSTFEDIQYHIYVREKIERGLDDIQQGRTLSQAEVERRMDKWLNE